MGNLLLLRRDWEQAQWLQDIATGTALSLQDAPDNIRSDREVVVAAVRHLGNNLIYASEELRDDKEIALLASSSPGFGGVYQHLSTELRAALARRLATIKPLKPRRCIEACCRRVAQ